MKFTIISIWFVLPICLCIFSVLSSYSQTLIPGVVVLHTKKKSISFALCFRRDCIRQDNHRRRKQKSKFSTKGIKQSRNYDRTEKKNKSENSIEPFLTSKDVNIRSNNKRNGIPIKIDEPIASHLNGVILDTSPIYNKTDSYK